MGNAIYDDGDGGSSRGGQGWAVKVVMVVKVANAGRVGNV